MAWFCTEKQEKYIRDLDDKLGYNSDERNFLAMSGAEASALIEQLKFECGFDD